jgi:trk system potassium uptake protein TrkH
MPATLTAGAQGMQLTVIVRTLGALFLFFSTTLLLPIGASWFLGDGELGHFLAVFAAALAIGAALWFPLARSPSVIRKRDGFVIVALMWTAMSVIGSVPLILALDIGLVDALFESASGFTTTGSTVIVGLDDLPPSLLLYRQEMQWLGGIGVVVLAIALLPTLGIGGMQLYKAEMPGPFKDERMSPRIARTAKSLCIVYAVLTIICAVSFWFAGMTPFDALAHSLSTISTGGYSTHDASFAYFDSAAIEVVAIVFMLIGGISFGLHFLAWQTLRFNTYLHDSQVRAFVSIVTALIALVAAVLYLTGDQETPLGALRYAAFEVVAVITSTGFGIADFSLWPLALPVLLIFSSFVGGCAGSSAGGIKVIRFVIFAKQSGVHIQKLIHPQALRPIRVDGRVVPPAVIEGIWGFFMIYIAVFAVLMILLMLGGMDQVTAFGAVATCLNNLGPGLGDVAGNFVAVSDTGKLLLIAAMLLGRLEIFTFLVLITPAFWRR